MGKEAKLSGLALAGLERSLSRLSRSSAGVWKIAACADYPGSASAPFGDSGEDGTAAVYLGVENVPLWTLLFTRASGLECVSRAFTGHAFPAGASVSAADKVMLTELGNILLNALINPLLNSLGKGLLPAIPVFLEERNKDLGLKLPAGAEPATGLRVIQADIDLQCGGASARLRLFAFLPEELARAIENA